MSCEITCPNFCPPVSPIICEPVVIVRERFIPQIVPVIHPIKVVEKINCVPVHQHIYKWENEECGEVTVSGKKSKKRPVRVSRVRNKK